MLVAIDIAGAIDIIVSVAGVEAAPDPVEVAALDCAPLTAEVPTAGAEVGTGPGAPAEEVPVANDDD